MSLGIEQEIREDLAGKLQSLEALHRALARELRALPPPTPEELVRALELASASIKDCAVYQENHFGDLIPLRDETLGETILVLRAAEALIKDVTAALLPELPDRKAPKR